MEQIPQQIIDNYRQADITLRLHIYLRYSEFRSEFLEIEQNEQALRSAPRISCQKKK